MQTRPEDYNVGWICALETERVVACELLDEEYTGDSAPRIDRLQDHNIYTFGRIHNHKVVIAELPQGRYGISSATRAAEHMQSSFPALQLSLMVGIAGGVPSQKHDIRLGDVVVSCPTGNHSGVMNYSFGRAVQEQEFEEIGHLASPPNILLSATGALRAQHKRQGHKISSIVARMLGKNRRLRAEYSRPGIRMDRLYKPNYIHSDQKMCGCQVLLENKNGTDLDGNSYLVQRSLRGPDEDDPAIHYGLIASADRLIKDATLRDALAQKYDVLCFEMEAAGIMNGDLGCLVIRGICDYADTHKNDAWQGYAAATAAAYAKELLELVPWSHPQSKTTGTLVPSAGQIISNRYRDMQGPAGINVEISSADTQRSLTHSTQDNLKVNVFLAGMRNMFTKSSEESRDAQISICIEIAKQSDQLKALVQVQQTDRTGKEQQEQDTYQGQVILDCISRCAKQKPLKAAEGLSKAFSGSADFSFEKSSNFYPEQYSVSQTLLDRIIFVASKERHSTKGYSIELFLKYIVKRRRWQRVHVCISAMEKTGDLSNIPVSPTNWDGNRVWTTPRPFMQMLESALQDLDLIGSVTRVDLPLYRDANCTFQYDFESVRATVDYEQKDLLDEIEGDAIRYFQYTGCAQYQESQLSTLKRLSPSKFLVTDGAGDYVEYTAPFARTAWNENEFARFIEQMMKAQRLSSCQGVVRFIGVVLDDQRNHIKGYLVEPVFSSVMKVFLWANFKNYIIPRALRRLWARQLVTSISEIHSRGIALHRSTVFISHSLDLVYYEFWGSTRCLSLPVIEGCQPPELSIGKDIAPEGMESMQKGDIFQLGYLLWRLSEHVPFGRRYLCVMAGCKTRPYYRCLDVAHKAPVSLPFSQHGDPALRGIIEKCRVEDLHKRPSAQELACEIAKEVSFEENEVEISHQKKAFRTAMKDILNHPPDMAFCDECVTPLFSYHFNCSICSDGDFDLCGSCVASGVHCFDSNHQLLKMRSDSSGNLIQEPYRPS